MKTLALGLVLLGLAAPVPGLTQDASPIVVIQAEAAPSTNARRDELTARLVAAKYAGADKMFREVVDDLIAAMEAEGGPSPTELAWMRKTMTEVIGGMGRTMMDDVAQIYASQLTIEELEALVAFTESPVGRQIALKELTMGEAIGLAIARGQVQVVEELARRYCSQFDCPQGAAKSAPATPRSKPR